MCYVTCSVARPWIFLGCLPVWPKWCLLASMSCAECVEATFPPHTCLGLQGRTPLDLAELHGKRSAAQVLRKHESQFNTIKKVYLPGGVVPYLHLKGQKNRTGEYFKLTVVDPLFPLRYLSRRLF